MNDFDCFNTKASTQLCLCKYFKGFLQQQRGGISNEMSLKSVFNRCKDICSKRILNIALNCTDETTRSLVAVSGSSYPPTPLPLVLNSFGLTLLLGMFRLCFFCDVNWPLVGGDEPAFIPNYSNDSLKPGDG